ncbi:hypothetical protein LCGC14_1886100 [marine sediment metagenome]|uniref:Uncharacterized protein n=1 Tax=marine sediment metagenome TaxID=412755 RepID=A0A0F9GP93_9ZZZZ
MSSANSQPSKKYSIILADPPWKFSGGIRSSKKIDGKYQHYYTPDTTVGSGKYKSVLSDADICNLGISLRPYLHEDSVLFMWTTDAHLPLALKVMGAWGLPYKTIAFAWNKKEKSGKQVCYYGKWTMKGTELCLLGSRGKANSLIKSHRVRGLVEAERGKHSEKPPEVRGRIVELMGDLPRVELFARRKVEGWDCIGNDIDGVDIYEAFNRIAQG